jgi:hypothetical protein
MEINTQAITMYNDILGQGQEQQHHSGKDIRRHDNRSWEETAWEEINTTQGQTKGRILSAERRTRTRQQDKRGTNKGPAGGVTNILHNHVYSRT